jgi:hypothetical protein
MSSMWSTRRRGVPTFRQRLHTYDDRRCKRDSVTDGMGPLTATWRGAAHQTTSFSSVPADATMKPYNNTGIGGSANAWFGSVADFINRMGSKGSTEPPKRFYKNARPYRWSTRVIVAPAMAYVLPERF